MKVCIAEKPSVAKEIAHVLGASVRHEGYFEGNGYRVTYTFGHLCTLWEPQDYKKHWKHWDLNDLPMLPERFHIKPVAGKGIGKQFDVIRKLVGEATEVINCGDAGQEGELIQRWVLQEAGYQGPMKRLWISSLTEEAIREGFSGLKPASDFENLYHAGFSRAIGDWLLGINASRLYTLKYAARNQVLSIGRVQTPTLAMVVNRYREIQNFKPQPYWELQTIYRNTVFSCASGRFLDREQGASFADQVQEQEFEITDVQRKNGSEYAPKLFDLTGLQVYCNTKFGFTAEETLKMAQNLYEQKLITYPRVDTTFLPSDLYPKSAGILSGLTQYKELTAPLLERKLKRSSRVFNDRKVTDHHAIIPTGLEKGLPVNQNKVYDSIVRRFIAAFYEDCKVAHTIVSGKAGEVSFRAIGKQTRVPGWRRVFADDRTTENPGDGPFVHFVVGEKGSHEPSFLEKETKAPGQYSEASLLRAMETAGKTVDDDELREHLKENGIGRPSTRASIIETLFRRNYIIRNKKQILPTETGMQLIDLIQNELLKSAELTGAWEKNLKQIEKGEYPPGRFIRGMKKMVDALVYEVRSSRSVRMALEPAVARSDAQMQPKDRNGIVGKPCPKCSRGSLLKGKRAYGCSEFSRGCDFVLPFVIFGKRLSEAQCKRLLAKGSTSRLKGFETASGKVSGSLRFDSQMKLELLSVAEEHKSYGQEDPFICPKCGTGTIVKGKKAYGCSAHDKGCDFRVPFEVVLQELGRLKPSKRLVYQILQRSV